MNRIPRRDRIPEKPLLIAQKRQSPNPGRLRCQSARDRQAQQPMRDRPPKRPPPCPLMIHMYRVEIPRQPRESHHIRLGDRPPRTLPLVAEGQLFPAQLTNRMPRHAPPLALSATDTDNPRPLPVTPRKPHERENCAGIPPTGQRCRSGTLKPLLSLFALAPGALFGNNTH